MEKRKVTVNISGQPCSFYSDDSDDYISTLARRANAVMRETAPFSGYSAQNNAIFSVVYLMDALMRAEKGAAEEAAGGKPEGKAEARAEVRRNRKTAEKASAEEKGQISMWELLEDRKQTAERALPPKKSAADETNETQSEAEDSYSAVKVMLTEAETIRLAD